MDGMGHPCPLRQADGMVEGPQIPSVPFPPKKHKVPLLPQTLNGLQNCFLKIQGLSTPAQPCWLEIPVSNQNALPSPPGSQTPLRGLHSSPWRGSDSQVPQCLFPSPSQCPQQALDLSFLPVACTAWPMLAQFFSLITREAVTPKARACPFQSQWPLSPPWPSRTGFSPIH